MSDQPSTSWKWTRRAIIGFATLIVLFIAFELVGSHEAIYRSESQLDVSTGRERKVSWLFGTESVEPQRETFVSRQLSGEVVGRQEWRPLTIRWGALMVQSHGHSGTDRLWRACHELEGWWTEGGFTESAKTQSARAVLRLLQLEEPYKPVHSYLDAIKERVERLASAPTEERRTNPEDLPNWEEFAAPRD